MSSPATKMPLSKLLLPWSSNTAFLASISSEFRTLDFAVCTYPDVSWEYPNKQGIGCNVISSDDTANYLSFLTKLRTAVGPNVKLSAAVGITPWAGSDGSPSSDVSGFAKQLDYLGIFFFFNCL